MNNLSKIFIAGHRGMVGSAITRKLNELGYESIFHYNDDKASNLDWFYHLTGGHTHTDFFAIRSTDYSKAGENEDWDEDSLFS